MFAFSDADLLRSVYSMTLIDLQQRGNIIVCVLSNRIFMFNVKICGVSAEKDIKWSVTVCLCLFRVNFSPPTPKLCVPAIGLSHSNWPRCHPSLHPRQKFSRTSGPRRRGWAGGLFLQWWGRKMNLGPKPCLMWKDISIYFQKHFRLCWQTQSDIAATPQLTPNATTCSVQILWFMQEMFHIATCCQQLEDFKL